jgi:hypothetical protein
MKILKYKRRIYYNETMKLYSGCQKNVPVFKRFFLQPYIRLCRTSEFRNIIMENGIISKALYFWHPALVKNRYIQYIFLKKFCWSGESYNFMDVIY